MIRNVKAFLDMIAFAEIGYGLMRATDDGYNVLCGSTIDKPLLFNSYDTHPNKRMYFGKRIYSTAAGRYQILYSTWVALCKKMDVDDFTPPIQDYMAIELIDEKGALEDVIAGRVEQAIFKCRKVWASFPGAGYKDQPTKTMESMLRMFRFFGGIVEGDVW